MGGPEAEPQGFPAVLTPGRLPREIMSLPNDWLTEGRALLSADTAMWAKTWDVVGDFAVNLTVALLILIGSIFVSRWAARAVHGALHRLRATRRDETLADFFSQVARWAVLIIGGIAVLQRLGVQTASIIAVLGAASLAIGLALRGTLSDLAAGVMLLILRPYRVGDQLEIEGHIGKVIHLDLFNTDLMTTDGRKVVIPNSKALSDPLVNRNGYPQRRVDLAFGVHYDTDIDHAFEVMRRTAEADPRVLADPPVWTGLTDLKDSAMEVTVYAWVKSPDWWETRCALRKAIKEAFDREKIILPYPYQVTVMDPADLPVAARPEDRPQDEGDEAPRGH